MYIIFLIKTASFDKLSNDIYVICNVIIALLMLASLWTTIRWLSEFSGKSNHSARFDNRENKSQDLLNYIIPYIFALVGDIDFDSNRDLISLAFFLIILGIMTANAGLSILNPVTAILGYRLYRASARIGGHQRVWTVLAKGELDLNVTYIARQIYGELYIVRKSDKNDISFPSS